MRQSPAFWQAVGLTLLGHGVVLGWLAAAQPPAALHGAKQGSGMTFLVRPLQLAAPEAASPPASPWPAEAGAALPSPAAPADPQRAAGGGAPGAEPSPAPAPAPAPLALAPATAPAAAGTGPEASYLPRGELTVPPRPLGPVDVPFPPDVEGMVDLRVRITLFIDERGAVQRVRVDTPDVHPAFERSIREAFGQARFSPGELDQVAVRSQLRLEVEFSAPGGRRRS